MNDCFYLYTFKVVSQGVLTQHLFNPRFFEIEVFTYINLTSYILAIQKNNFFYKIWSKLKYKLSNL